MQTSIHKQCRTFRCTPAKLYRMIADGGVHPIILVDELIRERMRVFELQGVKAWGSVNYSQMNYPWPRAPMIEGALAQVMQKHMRSKFKNNDAYYRACDAITSRIFGAYLDSEFYPID